MDPRSIAADLVARLVAEQFPQWATVNRWMPGRDLLSGPDVDRRALAADLAVRRARLIRKGVQNSRRPCELGGPLRVGLWGG